MSLVPRSVSRYRLLRGGLLLVVAMCVTRPAVADLTVFAGSTSSPARRPAFGAALGLSLAILGVEVEYSATRESVDAWAPALTTGSFNLLLQTPGIGRFQFYGTTGAGVYQTRRLGARNLGVITNVGGGVKLAIGGPVRVRIDYRISKLGGEALGSAPRRLYAGLNLAF